jgi:hypothetical protein
MLIPYGLIRYSPDCRAFGASIRLIEARCKEIRLGANRAALYWHVSRANGCKDLARISVVPVVKSDPFLQAPTVPNDSVGEVQQKPLRRMVMVCG